MKLRIVQQNSKYVVQKLCFPWRWYSLPNIESYLSWYSLSFYIHVPLKVLLLDTIDDAVKLMNEYLDHFGKPIVIWRG